MWAKHSVSAAEVQDVLYALEQAESIMFDGEDVIYLTA